MISFAINQTKQIQINLWKETVKYLIVFSRNINIVLKISQRNWELRGHLGQPLSWEAEELLQLEITERSEVYLESKFDIKGIVETSSLRNITHHHHILVSSSQQQTLIVFLGRIVVYLLQSPRSCYHVNSGNNGLLQCILRTNSFIYYKKNIT